MIQFSDSLLQAWMVSLLLPLTRILAMVAFAPVLSHQALPNRVRLGLGLALTLCIMPALPSMPALDLFSWQGFFVLSQQLLIGAAMGFSVRLVLAALDVAGQIIGMTMGLGFAVFFDPESQGQTSALNQFLYVLVMLVFLTLDGHLIMLSAIADSFHSLPIQLAPAGLDYRQLAGWGATIFSTGLLIALPPVAALLITNIALGILTRTAPQLNLFGIGFPITLGVGFIMLALTLPGMLKPVEHLLQEGFSHSRQVVIDR